MKALIIRAGDRAPAGFYRPGALYAVWDGANQIVGEYLGHHPGYGLPEFRPLVWRGPEAEPLRHICAGPRAQVQPIQEDT